MTVTVSTSVYRTNGNNDIILVRYCVDDADCANYAHSDTYSSHSYIKFTK